MGRWFANFLATNGYTVIICDVDEPTSREFAKKDGFRFMSDAAKAAQASQVVVFATPTEVTRTLIKKVVPCTRQGTLFVEISSVKRPVRKAIDALTRQGVHILSIHPMFGPGATSLRNKTIILAQPANSQTARRLLSLLRRKGAKIVRSSLDAHDRLVATTLGLPHLMNFAFIETLRHSGLSLDKAREIGGTTFRLQLLIAESLYGENLQNEASILASNKHCKKVFATFLHQVAQVRANILRAPQTELLKRLQRGSGYVRKDPMFHTAYSRFTVAAEMSNSS